MRVTADPTALLTPRGRELLARLETWQAGQAGHAGQAGNALALAERLRREYPADLVALAMAQQELRRTAEAKFSRAADMLFTRAGYEQSSSEAVARYRAARLTAAIGGGNARIADLCCGIGGDLIALAANPAADVLAVDRDETHARLARHNAAVYAAADRVTALVADVRDIPLAGLDAVFIDPARRSGPAAASAGPGAHGPGAHGPGAYGAARRFRAGLSEPPLDWCAALTEWVPAVCVKAAPGIPGELVPDGWEAEFIAEGRDLKEAVLWSPALTSPAASPRETAKPDGTSKPDGAPWIRRRATVLAAVPPGQPASSASLLPHPGDPVPLREPGEYLLDPNPAVTRAGLVEDLARALAASANADNRGANSADAGIAKIDSQIAFLTVDRPVTTPFARTLRVLYSAPWHEKQFARQLRELGIGAVDIRRRGLAGDVDQIRRRLKLSGTNRATVVITRVNNQPWGLICAAPSE